MHEKFKLANVNQGYRFGTLPYEEAFADALSQTQAPNYRRGRIYVEHFGARDTDQKELRQRLIHGLQEPFFTVRRELNLSS